MSGRAGGAACMNLHHCYLKTKGEKNETVSIRFSFTDFFILIGFSTNGATSDYR
jgi:hypothetical protein